MRKFILSIAVFAFVLKLFVWLDSGRFNEMFTDEERNYQIALNHHDGLGYTIDGKLTAFHASTPVFLYELLIENGIEKSHFVIFCHILNLVLFSISVYYFVLILIHYDVQKWIIYAITILYVVYPSNLIFIGSKFNYERLVLPIIIIGYYNFLKIQNKKTKYPQILLIGALSALSTLFRSQLIYVIPFIIMSFLFVRLLRKESSWMSLAGLVITFLGLTAIFHYPEMKKNKHMFGTYMLSTQSGYELMQGHSDIARGSWNGNWQNPESEYAKYSREVIPGIEMMNEYEESLARKEFALNWIINNPINELILILRKTAIFFIPKNFLGDTNYVNAVVHIVFLALLMYGMIFVATNKTNWAESLEILSPILAVLSMSIVFFVGFRWRYYAEPFMLIWIGYWATRIAQSKQIEIKKLA